MVIRVAVIGAGAAGLAALRHMKARCDEFEPVAFEQMPVIGGTWVYSDELLDTHGRPLPSSMYKCLRTNLPKELMAFPDFPFSEDLPSYIGHKDVLQYLDNYADHFGLKQFIRFETEVARVHPVPNGNGSVTWSVWVRDLTKPADDLSQYDFEAVLVCNGHYTEPFIPNIPGIEEFSGEIFHSHSYRTADRYKGKRVLVLGAKSSGIDLSIEIASVADKVWLCHRGPFLKTPLPENVTQAPGIKEVTNNDSAILDDGQILKNLDVIAFCTGYLYSFPFLSEDCRCTVTEHQRVMSLYKHLVHSHFTTLSFIGILKSIVPFPAYHSQVQFVLAALSGQMKLPKEEEMEDDIKKDFEWRMSQGMPLNAAHTMGGLQWDYYDHLAHLAGFECMPPVFRKLYSCCHELIVENILVYRKHNFSLLSNEEYTICNF